MINVRLATPQDEPAAAEVSAAATAALRRTYEPDEAALAHRATLSGRLTRLVALVDHRVVGTVQYTVLGDRLHLIGLAVHPDFQRRGVATALVGRLAEIGRRQGVRCLSLHAVKQTGNAPILKKLGFKPVSEHKDTYSTGGRYKSLTDGYMERPLA